LLLILDVMIAAIAGILSLLSLRTLKAIKHLGVGKSFWIPILMSGILFLAEAVISILRESNFTFTVYTDEVLQIIQILALTIDVAAVYSYSRRISVSLTEKFPPPQRLAQVDIQTKAPPTSISTAAIPDTVPIQDRLAQESSEEETVQKCPHELGYLRALPKDTAIPDECLRCDKIIRCKHSLLKTLDTPA
jgi:hypothetical protein